jgi:hypothetical protein
MVMVIKIIPRRAIANRTIAAVKAVVKRGLGTRVPVSGLNPTAICVP